MTLSMDKNKLLALYMHNDILCYLKRTGQFIKLNIISLLYILQVFTLQFAFRILDFLNVYGPKTSHSRL